MTSAYCGVTTWKIVYGFSPKNSSIEFSINIVDLNVNDCILMKKEIGIIIRVKSCMAAIER